MYTGWRIAEEKEEDPRLVSALVALSQASFREASRWRDLRLEDSPVVLPCSLQPSISLRSKREAVDNPAESCGATKWRADSNGTGGRPLSSAFRIIMHCRRDALPASLPGDDVTTTRRYRACTSRAFAIVAGEPAKLFSRVTFFLLLFTIFTFHPYSLYSLPTASFACFLLPGSCARLVRIEVKFLLLYFSQDFHRTEISASWLFLNALFRFDIRFAHLREGYLDYEIFRRRYEEPVSPFNIGIDAIRATHDRRVVCAHLLRVILTLGHREFKYSESRVYRVIKCNFMN